MSDLQTINYQPLVAMRYAGWKTFTNSFRTPLGIIAFLAAVIVGIAGTVISLQLGYVAIAITLYVSFISYEARQYRYGVWDAFATANGWQVDTAITDSDALPPSVQYGHSQKNSPVIRAMIGNLQMALLTYQCTTGYGKYRTDHYFTVAMVSLPYELPHMLLLSRKANIDTQRDLLNAQEVQLEGDFNKYFKLLIEQGQQIDALAVITPDVMQTLVQYNQSEDIETVNGRLYFILGNDQRNPDDMPQLLQSVTELAGQIIENARLAHGTPKPAVTKGG